MSAEPPPPPQLSPDGKFYWDGQRWMPMAQPRRRSQAREPKSLVGDIVQVTNTLTTRRQRTQIGCGLLILAYGAGALVTVFPIVLLAEAITGLHPDSQAMYNLWTFLSVVYTVAFVIVLGRTRGWGKTGSTRK